MSKRIELLEGETILVDEPIHWKNYLTALLTMALGMFLMLVRLNLRHTNLINYFYGKRVVYGMANKVLVIVEVVLLAVLVLSAFLRTVDISYIHYYLTNKRVISTSGVINRNFAEMLLSRVEMVYLNQNAYERMYSCGDILCVSAGASLFLDDVKNALRFKQMLMELLAKRGDDASYITENQ